MADALLLNFGSPVPRATGGFGVTNMSLDQTTDALEVIFQAREAATITRLGVRLASITGTTPTYRISLQGVDASGNPDGTVKGGGSPASATFSPSSLGWAAGSWNWITLDNSFAIARGDFLSLVVDYSSGTVDGSNFAALSGASGFATAYGLPYWILNNAGSRSRQNSIALFGYGSSSKAYGFPCNGGTSQSISTTTEAALKFTVPSGWSSTMTVVGLRVLVGAITAARTVNITLYDGGGAGDTTALQTVAWDSDAFQGAGASRIGEFYFDETTLSTLTVGNTYRLALACTGAGTNNIGLATVAAVDDWDAWPGGQNCLLSTRTGGDWTDVATSRPLIEAIFADLTASGGASGARLVGASALVTPGG